jgi:enoyl-CoA hydratase/carnithine racemase
LPWLSGGSTQILTSGYGFPVPEGGIDPFGLSSPRCSKPLVMAAQGYCFTWGVELMLTTDVRIAAADHIFDDMAEVLQSEDAQEGIQSFNERRDAVFKGK